MDQLDPGYEVPVVRRSTEDVPGGPLGPGHSFAEEERLRRLRPTPMGEARAIPPQVASERIGSRMADAIVRRGGVSRESAEAISQSLMGGERSVLPLGMGLVRDFTGLPSAYLWAADSGQRAGRAMAQGDYGTAALETGFGLLPLGVALGGARRAPDAIDRAMKAGGRSRQRGMFLLPETPQELAAQRRAEALEASGTAPEKIWEQTGLARFPDGKWRTELSDAASVFRGAGAYKDVTAAQNKTVEIVEDAVLLKDLASQGEKNFAASFEKLEGRPPDNLALDLAAKKTPEQLDVLLDKYRDARRAGVRNVPMERVLEHPELYGRVPDLANLPTTFAKPKRLGDAYGQYRPGRPGAIDVAVRYGEGEAPDEARTTLLHEITHAVQQKYGFEPGTSPEEIQAAAKQSGVNLTYDEAYQLYHASMGEVEARLTAARRDLTAAQRRAAFPMGAGEYAMDVPVGSQLTSAELGAATSARPRLPVAR